MLDLRESDRGLHSYHQRFLDDGLPPELSRAAFAAFDPRGYSPREVDHARRSWTLRALDEYRSLTAFTSLLDEIARLNLPFDALGTAVRIVRDEDRHVELCRRMVVALGGSSNLEGDPAWVRAYDGRPSRERLLRMVVGSLCVGETLSVRFLAAVREATPDPLARAVATCLVADEAIHSRFGWTMLEHLLPALSRRERRLIDSLLPAYLAEAARVMIPANAAAAGARPEPKPSPFGSLSPRRRAEVFADSFERDVLSRFESFGIHARAMAPAPFRVAKPSPSLSPSPRIWARLFGEKHA